MRNDTRLIERLQKARGWWQEFLDQNTDTSTEELARKLTLAQISFEHNVFNFDRGDAKDVMATTCFAVLYDPNDGFDDRKSLAKRMAIAFLSSHCSSEVKSDARRAIVATHLDIEEEVKPYLRYI